MGGFGRSGGRGAATGSERGHAGSGVCGARRTPYLCCSAAIFCGRLLALLSRVAALRKRLTRPTDPATVIDG